MTLSKEHPGTEEASSVHQMTPAIKAGLKLESKSGRKVRAKWRKVVAMNPDFECVRVLLLEDSLEAVS